MNRKNRNASSGIFSTYENQALRVVESLRDIFTLTRPQLSSYNYNFIQRAARGKVGAQGKIPTLCRAVCCMKTTGDESDFYLLKGDV